ncbi:MAG TPA: hypothetical protein VN256_15345 [Pyrinomonadaceae bacterium]|nr:hypothetical protein [Pyrinomonadaceae bacterium]
MAITSESGRRDADGPRKTIFIIAGAVAVLLAAGLIVFLKTRPDPKPGGLAPEPKLEGGLRAGSPEFDKAREMIKLDEPVAEYGSSVAGDVQMNLATTVRNFTGRTITGLEMRASVTGLDGKLIKERTKVVLPSGSLTELENNGTARAPISIPGFRGEDKAKIEAGQATINMEVTAVKFK